MKINVNSAKSTRVRGFALTVALSVAASGGLLTPKRADAYFASEVTQILNNISLMLNQIQDYGAYAADKLSWIQQARDMQKQLTSLQSMGLALGLKDGQEMREIPNPKQFLVKEKCGEQFGQGVGGIIGNLTGINMNGAVFEEQYKICAQKQWLQNEQYNIGVRYMKENVQQMEADFPRLVSLVNSATDPGDNGKVLQNGGEVDRKYAARQRNHQELMDAYSAAIASLDGQTQALGRAALRGNSGLIRQMVSTASAYTALCSGGRCDD